MADERRDPTLSGRVGDWYVWLVERVGVILVLVAVGWLAVRYVPDAWRWAKGTVVSWTDPLVGNWRSPDNQDIGFEFRSDGTLLMPGMLGFPGSTPPDEPDAISEYMNLRVEYTREEKSIVIRSDYRKTKSYREQGIPRVAKDGVKIEVVPYTLDGDVLTFGNMTLVRRR